MASLSQLQHLSRYIDKDQFGSIAKSASLKSASYSDGHDYSVMTTTDNLEGDLRAVVAATR